MAEERKQLIIPVPSGIPIGPIPDFLCKLIRDMAKIGYWPMDFGEDCGTHLELCFLEDKNIENALSQAERFIKLEGQV